MLNRYHSLTNLFLCPAPASRSRPSYVEPLTCLQGTWPPVPTDYTVNEIQWRIKTNESSPVTSPLRPAPHVPLGLSYIETPACLQGAWPTIPTELAAIKKAPSSKDGTTSTKKAFTSSAVHCGPRRRASAVVNPRACHLRGSGAMVT